MGDERTKKVEKAPPKMETSPPPPTPVAPPAQLETKSEDKMLKVAAAQAAIENARRANDEASITAAEKVLVKSELNQAKQAETAGKSLAVGEQQQVAIPMEKALEANTKLAVARDALFTAKQSGNAGLIDEALAKEKQAKEISDKLDRDADEKWLTVHDCMRGVVDQESKTITEDSCLTKVGCYYCINEADDEKNQKQGFIDKAMDLVGFLQLSSETDAQEILLSPFSKIKTPNQKEKPAFLRRVERRRRKHQATSDRIVDERASDDRTKEQANNYIRNPPGAKNATAADNSNSNSSASEEEKVIAGELKGLDDMCQHGVHSPLGGIRRDRCVAKVGCCYCRDANRQAENYVCVPENQRPNTKCECQSTFIGAMCLGEAAGTDKKVAQMEAATL